MRSLSAAAAVVAAAAAFLLLAHTASAASRQLTGSGPAYWQDASASPLNYPAAAAAVEGYVVNPMGGPSYCNARLVKPVCVDGMWVQNRCIAQLQSLSIVAESQCLETKDVFAGAPAATTAAAAPAVMQPIPVTAAAMKKYASKGYVFRGIAAAEVPGTWRVNEVTGTLESRRTRSLIDSTTRFWWSSPTAASQSAAAEHNRLSPK